MELGLAYGLHLQRSLQERNWFTNSLGRQFAPTFVPFRQGYNLPYDDAFDSPVTRVRHISSSRFSLAEPVVRTFDPREERYTGSYDYTFDFRAKRVEKADTLRPSEGMYSSIEKAFYGAVPFNTLPSAYGSPLWQFDVKRLRQTDVVHFIHRNSRIDRSEDVSLANTISPLLNKMGSMTNSLTGEALGTCTLIAHNLVLVARHAVEGCDIRKIRVDFGYTAFNGSFYRVSSTNFDGIIEENAKCDYAIIRIKEPLGKSLGFVSLNANGPLMTELALLHYPLGQPLKVSVHAGVQTQYQANRLTVYHDSDYLSSGGAYFDPMGHMVAMHLGAELSREGDTMNLFRYALPLGIFVSENTHSLLSQLINGKFSQATSYSSASYLTYLSPTDHDYLMDEEGRESEKILRRHLGPVLATDKKIKRISGGKISFSLSNLEYIRKNYSREFTSFKEECLALSGEHGQTRLYSVAGVIESDHTIPHHVWKSTTDAKMQAICAKGGSGSRKGENFMPAITIPYDVHRPLLTTGSGADREAFRQSLVDLCDQGKIDKALAKCYQQYKVNGLDTKAGPYRRAIEKSLDEHINLGLITAKQKAEIIATL